ncbi:hypothetical protein GOP47_0014179 [Adiantum capillus-veneris]|uniref:BACK domain-containing protein n=1 Tax=Adiantum capillus-veneris TaxID=13818 RepID=A0A9D4UR87_ADICA|nr:hypothetical protein GOP47_0014179 [Adiantum capillus-veneris]
MRCLMQRLSNWIVHDSHLSLECYMHLSELAFIHLVQNLDRSRFTLQEYCVFHLVVQWCLSQVLLLPGEPSITNQTLMNDIDIALPWTLADVRKRVAMTTDEIRRVSTSSTCKGMSLLKYPVSSCLAEVCLDLSKIPSQVLNRIIEPLKIVPKSMLSAAYKKQALSIPVRW